MFAVLFLYLTETHIWDNGSDQIQGWMSPLQKLRDETFMKGLMLLKGIGYTHFCQNCFASLIKRGLL